MKNTLILLPLLLGLAACGQNNKVSVKYETDTFTTKSGMTVTFYVLVHASILIEYDGRTLVIDPVRKIGDRTVDYSPFHKADYFS